MQVKYLSVAIVVMGTMVAAPTKRVDIIDPVFNLKAFSYTVPADWTFDGAVMPGTSCVNASTPFWRATSPDGLTGVKLLPRTDWSWSSRPIPGQSGKNDCLPLKQVMKARDFLTYMMPILGVRFVRETDEPEAAAFQRQMQENTRQQRPTVWTGDRARVVVKYEIKGHPVEELLVGLVMCSDAPVGYVQPPLHIYSCSASVWRTHAPAGRLDVAADMLNSITGSYVGNPEWSQRWNALMTQKISDTYARQTVESLARGEQAARILEQRRKAFDQAQAERYQQHQDFMSSMQRGADLRNARFQDQQYAKRQTAEDWCDYALDCTRSWDDRVRVGNCMNRQTLP